MSRGADERTAEVAVFLATCVSLTNRAATCESGWSESPLHCECFGKTVGVAKRTDVFQFHWTEDT